MRRIILIWISAQLVVIGFIGAYIDNQVYNGTYECSETKDAVPYWTSMVFPLIWFVQDEPTWDTYCENQLNGKS